MSAGIPVSSLSYLLGTLVERGYLERRGLGSVDTVIATAPSVEYRLTLTDGTVTMVDNPADMPEAQRIASIEEPFFKVTVLLPAEYTGTVMELCQARRAEMTLHTILDSVGSLLNSYV